MKPTVTLALALLLAAGAQAGDVYVTKDAQGNPIYTDTPATIPAQKVGIASTSTDPATVQKRYADQMKQYATDDASASKAAAGADDPAKAKQLSAEDKAKRCADARQRYQSYVDAHRLYEDGPDGQRRYLTSEEIDASRASAKQVMDQFCSGQ
jgi:Domain of unknown function (DUF4124)